MNMKYRTKSSVKTILAVSITLGTVLGTTFSVLIPSMSASSTKAIADPSDSSREKQMAMDTLNSFYKLALQGRTPDLLDLTVGKSKRSEVVKRLGEPEETNGGFEGYPAQMGHPGYAFLYRYGVIHEVRYFGTNVERQTNIGGITLSMLRQQWGKPAHSTVIHFGGKKQIKETYRRGDYKLEFIFNSETDLDHINLTSI